MTATKRTITSKKLSAARLVCMGTLVRTAFTLVAILLPFQQAFGANDRYYVAKIQPSDVAPNTTTNYNVSVTNNILSGPSHFLRQVILTVPSAFTITGPVTVQAPPAAPLPWKATVSGNTITVISGSVSDASVAAGQGITITVPAKAPALSGACPKTDSYTWGISASQVVGGGTGNAYLQTPGDSDPVVTVSCDTLTNLNLTISPDAFKTTDTGVLFTLTATLTKVVGGFGIGGETIAFTVGGQPAPCQSTPITGSNGVATCSYDLLPNVLLPPPGPYFCQATFAGDSALGLGSSTSPVVDLSINSTGTGLLVSPETGAYGGSVNLSATLTASGSNLSGKTVNFALGATSVGSGTTNSSGVATVPNVSLVLGGVPIPPGIWDGEIIATFAGDATYAAANGSAALTVGLIAPTITWANPKDIVYGTPLSDTQLNATASVLGTFAYSPAAGIVLNAGLTQTLSVTFTPTDLKTYSTATASVFINVTKANPIPSISPYNVPYNGAAHTATGTVVGVLGETLATATNLALGSTTHTNAGDYPSDAWTFTDVTGNYNNASGTVHDVITKANATIVVTPYSVTYDGSAHTATGTATGVPSGSLSGLVLSGTTHTNAGDYPSDAWTFTDVTGNYNNTSGTVHDAIAKATAIIVVTPYSVTYDGNLHTATGAATGVGGANLSAFLNLSGTAHTAVGTYLSDTWSFAGGNNYNNAGGTVSDTITGADQTITFTSMIVTAATTAPGLTVTFTTSTPGVCSVTQVLGSDNVTPVTPGQATVTLVSGQTNWSLCKVQANQNGAGTNYNPALQVTGTLTTQ